MLVRIKSIDTELRVPREELDNVLRALTELTVTLWLIEQGRFQDVQYYSAACTTPIELLRQQYEDEALSAGVYDIAVTNDQDNTDMHVDAHTGDAHE